MRTVLGVARWLGGPFRGERDVRGLDLVFGNVDHGEVQLLPFMEATQERTHMPDTVFAELQRHTGAGGFVGSSTEEDDFAVAINLAMTRLQFLRRNPQSTGQGAGIGQYIQRMAQVDDGGMFAGFELVL